MTGIRAIGVSKSYVGRSGTVLALDDATLSVSPGELLIVRGPSGSGKTTLLSVLGGLVRPDSGEVWVDERELNGLGEAERREVMRTRLGFIFQAFSLIPVLSATENVEVPLRMQNRPARERDALVARHLEAVGLADHARQRPAELSGGQQQRVGIARALVTDPQILLADEPTGQLDSRTGATIMQLIVDLVRERNVAAIVTTHDPLLMRLGDRVLELRNGRLSEG